MTHLIAIYGQTCSAKTETARELSRMTGNMVMHPGEAITTRAKMHALDSGAAVEEAFHREVDEETRARAQGLCDLMIFESSQLDAVLGPREDVFYVRLFARDEVREARWNHRREEGGGRTRQIGESVARRDRDDADLRARLYPDAPAVTPALEIDSSDRSATECAVQILAAFQTRTGTELALARSEMDKTASKGITPGPSSGTVRSYAPDRPPFGGYITDTRSGRDLYVHKSAVSAAGLAALETGQTVNYDVVEDGFGGFKATKLAEG